MEETITISHRFRGPPDSGNGGYVCGILAQHLEGAVEVRLHQPPPLERPLRVHRLGDEEVQLLDGEEVVASAKAVELEQEIPKSPSFAEAQAAVSDYLGFKEHLYPSCFVCGTDRKEKDGLRIFPGHIPGGKLFASPWIPDETLADDLGLVRPEFLWASLDCPGAWAAMEGSFPWMLLGTLSVKIEKQVKVGERCVACGWLYKKEGRKLIVGTALFSETGELLAHGKAIWILLNKNK
ncbi:MAG: hypothetical protein R3257_06505 [bacterium]|nr:hypothetical protein [bacterium]